MNKSKFLSLKGVRIFCSHSKGLNPFTTMQETQRASNLQKFQAIGIAFKLLIFMLWKTPNSNFTF